MTQLCILEAPHSLRKWVKGRLKLRQSSRLCRGSRNASAICTSATWSHKQNKSCLKDLILEEELIKFLILGICPLTWGVFMSLGFSLDLVCGGDTAKGAIEPEAFECNSWCFDFLWNGKSSFLDTAKNLVEFGHALCMLFLWLYNFVKLCMISLVVVSVTFYLKHNLQTHYEWFQSGIVFPVLWSLATMLLAQMLRFAFIWSTWMKWSQVRIVGVYAVTHSLTVESCYKCIQVST